MVEPAEPTTMSTFTAREGSPSPSASPTPAISSCPSPDRTFSTISSVSGYSDRSASRASSTISTADRRSSSFSTSSRRRGYVRTQGASFADSAKNRESVMSLGSIAHLQYYFARTGLLDGKGAQVAKEGKKASRDSTIPTLMLSDQTADDVVESPVEGDSAAEWQDSEPIMLPPTVSTYSHRNHYVPPPPDMKSLKKDLVNALEEALKALEATSPPDPDRRKSSLSEATEQEARSQGFEDLIGMHILDTVTLAIRAARIYYTSHANPDRLAKIRSERQIRAELIAVLDVLKGWTGRKFAGGLQEEERIAILVWLSEVGQMLDQETRLEEVEKREREGWRWMSNSDGTWKGKEKEREWAFLKSLQADATTDSLPPWPENTNCFPTPFLEALADGRTLIQFHNAAVARSKRRFGEIKTHHEDIAKPYRRADNLRFWIKAAEIRWEIKITMDVMGVVYATTEEAWKGFEEALMAWCKGVRRELTRDWKEGAAGGVRSPAPGGHIRNQSSVATVRQGDYLGGEGEPF
ncbi:MAG: hypothetical protein Q9227_008011 [Pyrenula ochraceoflavens]